MAHTTANSSPFIKATQYSDFILSQLHDGMLPAGFYRNVSDFGEGTTLNIPVIGSATIREVTENQPIVFDAISTSTVTMSITDYVSDAWYVTDKMKQDSGSYLGALEAGRAGEGARAINERFETTMLEAAGGTTGGQTVSDGNTINGMDHRYAALGANEIITLEDFFYMKAAFDKADIPDEGRIAIVDPVVEMTLNGLVGAQAFTNNPQFMGLVTEGFARSHKFIRNIFGWDIYVSNRLPRITAAETMTAGPGGAETCGVGHIANVFMSLLDDQTKPMIGAWRQAPRTEGERNVSQQRDEYTTTARWGWGVQRPEGLGVILTHPTTYK